jgi:hypothetical protein
MKKCTQVIATASHMDLKVPKICGNRNFHLFSQLGLHKPSWNLAPNEGNN